MEWNLQGMEWNRSIPVLFFFFFFPKKIIKHGMEWNIFLFHSGLLTIKKKNPIKKAHSTGIINGMEWNKKVSTDPHLLSCKFI